MRALEISNWLKSNDYPQKGYSSAVNNLRLNKTLAEYFHLEATGKFLPVNTWRDFFEGNTFCSTGEILQ